MKWPLTMIQPRRDPLFQSRRQLPTFNIPPILPTSEDSRPACRWTQISLWNRRKSNKTNETQRGRKQFSQRTSSKGTFVVVVATTLNIHLYSSISISLINYTIIISRILNRVDPWNGYKSGLVSATQCLQAGPPRQVTAGGAEKAWWGNLGLDDGSRSVGGLAACRATCALFPSPVRRAA